MKYEDEHDARKASIEDQMNSRAEEASEQIKDPVISVCRQTKSVACFDGITLIREFYRYDDEDSAVGDALQWFDTKGVDAPRIIYPHISKAIFR